MLLVQGELLQMVVAQGKCGCQRRCVVMLRVKTVHYQQVIDGIYGDGHRVVSVVQLTGLMQTSEGERTAQAASGEAAEL